MKEVRIAVLVGFFVVAGWIVWASHSHQLGYFFNAGVDTSTAGTWGDSFGAFNALFGALGFTAVVATLFMQSRALSAQQADQHRQRFENTFFQLLALMRELRSDITYRYSKEFRADAGGVLEMETLRNVGAIAGALKELDHWRSWSEIGGALNKDDMAAMYKERVHSRFERNFGPYFRTVYSILKRVRNDNYLTADEKVTFGNLVRGQLTSDEIELAAFNALMPDANDFADLLVHFRMLKYLPDAKMREVLSRYYSDEAFQGRA